MGTKIERIVAAWCLLALLPIGCHRMTEEQALEAAREEIRRELQPQIDQRRKEIRDLERRIAELEADPATRRQPRGEEGRP